MSTDLGHYGDLARFAVTDDLKQRFHISDDWHFAVLKQVEWNLYFETLGHPRHAMDVPGPVMKHLETDYLRGLAYHTPVCVTGRVVSMRNTSLVMTYATWDADGCCNSSTQLFVMVVNQTGEKAPIPAALRAAIIALDDPETA